MSAPDRLGHLDARGHARMVDVSHKPVVARRAHARAVVRTDPDTAAALAEGRLPKGDAAAVARVGGIVAAKRTPELIALCHPLPLDHVAVEVEVEVGSGRIVIDAETRTSARTGVEMEALVAATVAALNVYDLVKGRARDLRIEEVRLLDKRKGVAPGGSEAGVPLS